MSKIKLENGFELDKEELALIDKAIKGCSESKKQKGYGYYQMPANELSGLYTIPTVLSAEHGVIYPTVQLSEFAQITQPIVYYTSPTPAGVVPTNEVIQNDLDGMINSIVDGMNWIPIDTLDVSLMENISLHSIQQKLLEQSEQGNHITTVYVHPIQYHSLLNDLAAVRTYGTPTAISSGINTLTFNSITGSVQIKVI